mmetsp:Transcript_52726/g.78767  ORF Transcript_52726/g.78767 Transcript_52726/m.78767 type:complete len:218 (-) Transcript_52726:2182-2835(-)
MLSVYNQLHDGNVTINVDENRRVVLACVFQGNHSRKVTFCGNQTQRMQTSDRCKDTKCIAMLGYATKHLHVGSIHNVVLIFDIELLQLGSLQEARDHHLANLLPEALSYGSRFVRSKFDALRSSLVLYSAKFHQTLHASTRHGGVRCGHVLRVVMHLLYFIGQTCRSQSSDCTAPNAKLLNGFGQQTVLSQRAQDRSNSTSDFVCLLSRLFHGTVSI